MTVHDFDRLLDPGHGPEPGHGQARRQGGRAWSWPSTSCGRRRKTDPAIGEFQVPESWFIASDGLIDFIHYNFLEDFQSFKFSPHRGDPAQLPLPRAGLQAVVLLARDARPAAAHPGRHGRGAAHRPLLEPARGQQGDGLLGQVPEPLPGQHRAQGGAPGRPGRGRGRGLRLDLQSRRHPVPGRARPAGLLRGDGRPHPARRRAGGSAAISSRPSPAWPSATTSSAGRPASSARTASCAWSPAWGRGPSTGWRTTIPSSSAPASRASG